jgi:hypothetical protein
LFFCSRHNIMDEATPAEFLDEVHVV